MPPRLSPAFGDMATVIVGVVCGCVEILDTTFLYIDSSTGTSNTGGVVG